MKHYLNVCDVNGFEIEPVDVITFGSPCQDLSLAGKRSGLKHESKGDDETTRSGLFMEAIRIIKEMREKTNGKYPRFAVWENVPGAFSSNKGEDFRIVLEQFCRVKEPNISIPSLRNGTKQEQWSLITSHWLGEPWMQECGESPNEERESFLSQILMDNAPEAYSLSRKACEGIIRRANARGKVLPEILKNALLNQIERLTLEELDSMDAPKQ